MCIFLCFLRFALMEGAMLTKLDDKGAHGCNIINMFENKIKKQSQRTVTSKSTSRHKQSKKQLIEAVHTDTTGLKAQKSKSQCLPRDKEYSRKSIDVKKLLKPSLEKFGLKTRHSREMLSNCPSEIKTRKPLLYDNIMTEKAVELRWHHKNRSSISKKKQTRSAEREKKEWDQARAPLSCEVVLQEYSHLLTKYEQNQIKQYKKVYFVGQKAKKREKIDSVDPNFDNQQKQYNFLLNDHIAYRFEILSQIGKGSYGQVFKVFDHKNKQPLALKMIKNRAKFSKQAFVEIEILTKIKEKDLQGTSNIIKIKDFVIFRKHVCIIFELMSENLYQLIIRNNYNGLDLDLIRRFAIQILNSLEFLRRHQIIHCDLKPENILLKQYHRSGIKIIDFGSSCLQNETVYTYIQSRYYRAPQITLGIEYDCNIDVWSVGCILGELYTGVPLFPGENQSEQMKYFVNTLGAPSEGIVARGSRSQVFFQGNVLRKEIMELKTIEYFNKTLAERIPDEEFRKFIESFLRWNPKERITPAEALRSKWIINGIPEHLKNHELVPKQSKQEQKSVGSKTVRISKSNSRDKKSKQSITTLNPKKTLPAKC